ncbi:MAG: diguanylate cyclase [Phycisphaerae bacterium]|jgi:diguanylate cyclase (GGDEF)-like protein
MEPSPVDVCMIEDDADQRALLLRRLLAEQFSVAEARDGQEGLEQIRRHHARVVVSDLHMPVVNGLDVCRQIRRDPALDGTYVIIVTSHATRKTRNEVLNAGADDILSKPYDFEELLAHLRNGLRISHLQERLRKAALTDGLTGLWNHTQFRNLLDSEFARTRRYGGVVSMVMLDLDHFKAVNDTYGHELGNHVLQATARHLEQAVRDTDTVARYGGEEFAVICPQTRLEEAANLAERIRHTLPQQVRIAECPQLCVTATLGVVSSEEVHIGSVTDLINKADQALYQGKGLGRNRVIRGDTVSDDPAVVGIQAGEVDRLRKQVLALSMQAKELCLQSVWSLVQALEARDRFTAWQSRNVTFYTTALVEAAGWPEGLRLATINAAMLHNLGKIGVPDRILQKPDALTAEEATVLRQVPLIAAKILEPLRIFETEILIIRHLRERYDGTGYPHGLNGTTIPLGSRILALAEAFDAMTSDRIYRRRRSIDDAVTEIKAQTGKQFDPQFTDLLLAVLADQRDRWQAHIDQMLSDGRAQSLLVT